MSQGPFPYAEQFQQLEEALAIFAIQTHGIDLEQLQQTLDRTHTLGPFLDPTAYQKALFDGRIERQMELVDAAAPLLRYVRKRVPALPAGEVAS